MKLSIQKIKTLQHFFADKPVFNVYLFGSYARGDAGRNSDIDLLIHFDFESMPTGIEYFDMWGQLEKLMKKKIDFVSSRKLSSRVKEEVERDKILIYEKDLKETI